MSFLNQVGPTSVRHRNGQGHAAFLAQRDGEFPLDLVRRAHIGHPLTISRQAEKYGLHLSKIFGNSNLQLGCCTSAAPIDAEVLSIIEVIAGVASPIQSRVEAPVQNGTHAVLVVSLVVSEVSRVRQTQ